MAPVSPRRDESGFHADRSAAHGRYRCTGIVHLTFPTWQRPSRWRDAALVQIRSEPGQPGYWLGVGTGEPGTSSGADGTGQGLGFRWAVGRQDCVKAADAAAAGVHPGGVPNRRPTVRGGLGSPLVVGSPVAAGGPRLMVRLRHQGERADVEARDSIGPGRPLLVALGHRPVLDGVGRYTRIGRLTPSVGAWPSVSVSCCRRMRCSVSSPTLRFCTAAEAMLTRLGGPSWRGRCRGRGCRDDAAGRRRRGAHRAAGGPLLTDLADSVSRRAGTAGAPSIVRMRSVATAAAVG
jgi:hypothetical protein